MNNFFKYLSAAAAGALLIIGASFAAVSADEAVQTTEPASAAAEETQTTSVPVTSVVTDISSDVTSAAETEAVSSETTVSSAVTSQITSSAVTCPDITEEIQEGWNSIDDKWFYFDGEKFLTGKQEIDGDYYVFSPNGSLRTGWQTVNSKRYYYDKETHSPVYGWIEFLGQIFYSDKENGKYCGIQAVEDNTYIFDEAGVLHTGFVTYNGFMYYCDETDGIIYGNADRTPIEIDGRYYLISPKGYVLRGWQTVNGLRVFYDYETGQQVNGWIEYMGHYYYADAESGKYTGDRYIDGYPYRFGENGIICTGIQTFEDGAVSSYFYADGTRAVDEIVHTDSGSYYFDAEGFMETDWQIIGEDKYFFDASGKMAVGICTINGQTYYFDADGRMQTGLIGIGNSKYYFNESGVMQFGWQIINGKKYYFDLTDGTAYTGWNTIDGYKYYFNDSAVMLTGKTAIGDDTYYFGSDGRMCVGWQTINGDKYYFGTDGKMATYRHNIDGQDYLFYSTGVMATTGNNTIVLKALSQLGQEGGRPYWTWWGFNFRIEWCACFVSWCAAQCGYTANGNSPEFISCKVGIDWFKEHNQWMGRDYIPKSGDYIFFDWDPDGAADHIGIVDYYENGYVYTVEGNSSDMVRKKVYDIKSENIFGFAAPNFPQ
ncbi:MAG: CHAP domain-containing protein [Porcipelethomonas sp.]